MMTAEELAAHEAELTHFHQTVAEGATSALANVGAALEANHVTLPEVTLAHIVQAIPAAFDSGMDPILLGPITWPEMPTLSHPT